MMIFKEAIETVLELAKKQLLLAESTSVHGSQAEAVRFVEGVLATPAMWRLVGPKPSYD